MKDTEQLPARAEHPNVGEVFKTAIDKGSAVILQSKFVTAVMTIEGDIAQLIPIGEENAVSARLLWKQLGMWSAPSIKAKLNEMAAAGLIERKHTVRGHHGTNLYFRSRA